MSRNLIILCLLVIGLMAGIRIAYSLITPETKKSRNMAVQSPETADIIYLPAVKLKGSVSVEEALALRRSRRVFSESELTMKEISQVLWAAYGVTDSSRTPGRYYKTAPSAGATYPLEVYLIASNVNGLKAGFYKYSPAGHFLTVVRYGDFRKDLCAAALNQLVIERAPACLFYSADYSRTTLKYGKRGRERYVPMDLGHSAQNVYLQAEALGLGTVAVGAFEDEKVSAILNLPSNEEPLYLMPLGRK